MFINLLKLKIKKGGFSNETQDYLNETLKELEHTINSITNKIEYHKILWFSYFRSYDITSEKESLVFLSNQLKQRFNLLIKISTTLK